MILMTKLRNVNKKMKESFESLIRMYNIKKVVGIVKFKNTTGKKLIEEFSIFLNLLNLSHSLPFY